MKNSIVALFTAALAFGCASSEGTPQTSAQASVCSGLTATDYQDALSLYSPGKVQNAERLYQVKRDTSHPTTRAGLATATRSLAGAKFYVPAERGLTAAYLERTLTCHSINDHATAMGAVVHPNDPLRVDGVADVDVVEAGPSFAVSVIGKDRAAGEAIWQRADALQRSTSVEVQQVSSRAQPARF